LALAAAEGVVCAALLAMAEWRQAVQQRQHDARRKIIVSKKAIPPFVNQFVLCHARSGGLILSGITSATAGRDGAHTDGAVV
jgi:hypothetical protein